MSTENLNVILSLVSLPSGKVRVRGRKGVTPQLAADFLAERGYGDTTLVSSKFDGADFILDYRIEGIGL